MLTSLHIKFGNEEAVSMKSETLLIQEGTLKTIQNAREYNSLRKKEFLLKNRMKKEISGLIESIISLEDDLPEEDLNLATKSGNLHVNKGEFLGLVKESHAHLFNKTPSDKSNKKDNDLDKELQEIHEKLAMLGRK